MLTITRRALTAGIFALTSLAALPTHAETVDELKIGYQKTGLLVIARQQGLIEKALEGKGIKVSWVEFTAGPPVVEALNVGSIQLGWTGDAPPIFGQSAGSAITYVAALPSNGQGEAIVVKDGSAIKTVADLKGKKVGFGKGTSANNLVVAALEKNGLSFADITPVYLTPADGAAAFASDKIDAFAVWDPFLAIAESRQKTRALARTGDVLQSQTFILGNSAFAKAHPDVVQAALKALDQAAQWAAANRGDVAKALHDVTGVPLAVQTVAADRSEFKVVPIDDAIIDTQQQTADRFFRIGLIPKKITVRDAVWTAPKS